MGLCNPKALRDALRPPIDTAVICDVEGYEVTLLDPNLVPELADTWILVELHDRFEPSLSDIIENRFRDTHRITRVAVVPRRLSDYRYRNWYTLLLPYNRAIIPVHEGRAKSTGWFWMEPYRKSGE